jgi:hypothetical protein
VWVLLVPTLILASSGFIAHVYGYIHYGVETIGGEFTYQLPLYASIAQIALLVNVFLVGIVLLSKYRQQTTARGKSGLLGISILYLLSATAGTLNVLLSGGSNNSPIIISSYVAGFVLFIGILLVVRLLRPPKSS